jgi:hypothetical protein
MPCCYWIEEEKRVQRKQIEQQLGRGREEKHRVVYDIILLRESSIKATGYMLIWQIGPPMFSFWLRHWVHGLRPGE